MLYVILAAAWGLLGGVAELLLLTRFVRSVTGGRINVIFGLLFVLLPAALLLPVAFIAARLLVYTGTAAVAALIIGAVVGFIISQKGQKKNETH